MCQGVGYAICVLKRNFTLQLKWSSHPDNEIKEKYVVLISSVFWSSLDICWCPTVRDFPIAVPLKIWSSYKHLKNLNQHILSSYLFAFGSWIPSKFCLCWACFLSVEHIWDTWGSHMLSYCTCPILPECLCSIPELQYLRQAFSALVAHCCWVGSTVVLDIRKKVARWFSCALMFPFCWWPGVVGRRRRWWMQWNIEMCMWGRRGRGGRWKAGRLEGGTWQEPGTSICSTAFRTFALKNWQWDVTCFLWWWSSVSLLLVPFSALNQVVEICGAGVMVQRAVGPRWKGRVNIVPQDGFFFFFFSLM